MRFRQYLGATMPDIHLAEADLLAKPAPATTPTPLTTSSPEASPDPSQSSTMPTGSGRPPGQMDDELKKALQMSAELGKTLATLPHPWNKEFHRYVEVLRALIAKLREVA